MKRIIVSNNPDDQASLHKVTGKRFYEQPFIKQLGNIREAN